jgi:ketosteroid isomerase-like protein
MLRLVTDTPIDDSAAAGDVRAIIADMQDAYRKGDFARIAVRFADDIDWLFQAPPSIFPAVGRCRGKAAVCGTFAALVARYHIESHVIDHVIAEGDRAAGVSDVVLVERDGGRAIYCQIASFFRVQDGLLTHYRGFTDSFDTVERESGTVLRF